MAALPIGDAHHQDQRDELSEGDGKMTERAHDDGRARDRDHGRERQRRADPTLGARERRDVVGDEPPGQDAKEPRQSFVECHVQSWCTASSGASTRRKVWLPK